jgi:hypothetical protein
VASSVVQAPAPQIHPEHAALYAEAVGLFPHNPPPPDWFTALVAEVGVEQLARTLEYGRSRRGKENPPGHYHWLKGTAQKMKTRTRKKSAGPGYLKPFEPEDPQPREALVPVERKPVEPKPLDPVLAMPRSSPGESVIASPREQPKPELLGKEWWDAWRAELGIPRDYKIPKPRCKKR